MTKTTESVMWAASAAMALGLAACNSEPSSSSQAPSDPADANASTTTGATTVLNRSMDSITGESVDLTQYLGNVVMIVNTASKCGFTKQYDALQELHETYADRGLVILGFPANDFGGQEPGSDEEIAEFCRVNYGVGFPMFSKIAVTGDEKHPLFEQLAALPEPIGGEPQWNFTKFVLDRSGVPVARFQPATSPTAPQVTAQIETLLDAG
ncbi:MAG: glutathione peroxidase [Planctomycetota bacterium]